MYSNIKVGKFQILATYSFAKAKLQGMNEEHAKQYGYMIAVMGAKGGAGSGYNKGSAVPSKSALSSIKAAAEKKKKSTITAEVYEAQIEEKLGAFYSKVFLPKITKLVKKGVSYDAVKALVKIPAVRGAKITGEEFAANLK